MKIAIDLDEVLGEFIAEFLRWYNPQHGTNWAVNDITDYHWPNVIGGTVEQAISDVHRFYETENFGQMPLVPGAQQGIAALSEQHELCVVTGRPYELKPVTLAWLDRHFPGIFRQVEFTNMYARNEHPARTKGEVCKQLGCQILLDDDVRHIDPLIENDVRLVIMDKPWNSQLELPEGVSRACGWNEAVEVIGQLVSSEPDLTRTILG